MANIKKKESKFPANLNGRTFTLIGMGRVFGNEWATITAEVDFENNEILNVKLGHANMRGIANQETRIAMVQLLESIEK